MENAKTPSKKKLLLGVLALVLVIGALIGVYFAFSPKPTQGAKTVTVEVIPLEGEGKESANQWWAISKSGEMATTGVDTTPIADGDHFELTLSVW